MAEHSRTEEEVRLSLPCGEACAALARTAAVSVGMREGLGRVALGALALAVDEALVLLLPTTDVGVDISFTAVDSSGDTPGATRQLTVVLGASAPQCLPDDAATARFTNLVAGLVDDAVVERRGTAPSTGTVVAVRLVVAPTTR